MERIKIKYDEAHPRRIMAVKATPKDGLEEDSKIYEVPMPLEGDQFHVNGVVYKITYLRDNPFRFSAEPTGEVILEVIEQIVSSQAEYEKKLAAKTEPKEEVVETKPETGNQDQNNS